MAGKAHSSGGAASTRDPFGPEVSDLIVDYDPETLERVPVNKEAVLARLEKEGRPRPIRIARALIDEGGVLDPMDVDGVLLRSHLELQRLHEEFRVGRTVRMLLAPMIDLVRKSGTKDKRIRVVDLGCGIGFILRWLSKHGELGDDVDLIGADYNRTLVRAASTLAKEEALGCSFVGANAFRLGEPAHIYISTGVLHHFRGDDLVRLFAEHAKSPALGFVHVDIRPSIIAPIGSYVFHVARMREPLAKWDGYWSAVRAHEASTLIDAVAKGAPRFSTATLDARPGLYAAVRIFQAVLGVSSALAGELERAYAPLTHRLEIASEREAPERSS